MANHHFRRIFLLLLVGLCLPLQVSSGEVAAPRTLNVIVILIDDLGWRDLGCYGSTFHETPNIDRLAGRGIKFTSAYSTCCVCSPSRASILTGKYPARLHLTDYIGAREPKDAKLRVPRWNPFLQAVEHTLARVLKMAGYVAGIIGKWHLGGNPLAPVEEAGPHTPKRHGFDVSIAACALGQPPDYFFPYKRSVPGYGNFTLPGLEGGREGEYLTDRLTAEAERFIDKNKDRPFFLFLSHYAVHTAIGARLQAKPNLIAKYKAKAKLSGASGNPVYAAMVESMDDSVGQILLKLENTKIADRTLIIFTSDNGGYAASTSNLPLRGAKASPYEGGVRVPLIIYWPGVVRPGSRCDVPVIGVDLFPTILATTGIKMAPGQMVDGESLVPLLCETGGLSRQAIFWHYPHYSYATTPYGSVRKGDFKLIEFFETDRLEMFNLRQDPAEKKDLTGEMPGKAQELRQLLRDWRREVGAQMTTANPDYKEKR